MPDPVLRLALPVPLPKLFDYLPPRGSDVSCCPPGTRVSVPFGRTRHIAVVIGTVGESPVPAAQLKRVSQVLDSAPMLDRQHLDFLNWVAGYYHYPQGEVVCAALPLRLRKQAEPLALDEPRWRVVEGGEAGVPQQARRQRALLAWLADFGAQGVAESQARQHAGASWDSLRRMLKNGAVERFTAAPLPDQYRPQAAEHALNAQQQLACDSVRQSLGQFAAFLLQGVTGSGKTEVYLQLARDVLARGDAVMILVPEISLTPQLQQRFAERLGGPVALLHSGLSETQRELAWQRVRLGLSRVLLGTRSLVLNPVPRLGLVVVDEEHDASFKQQEGFRYSARDLALVRAQRANCPVLLGSATPSLESLRNVQLQRYRLLQLTERAGNAVPPRIGLLDVRSQPLQSGLSEPLLNALRDTLDAGEQAMVFLNRRGYAPVLACYACGWLSDCPRCDAHQTLHRASNLLWCHHCGSQRRAPTACPQCGSEELHPLGQGTEQLEEFLQQRFTEVPLIRVDRDATSRVGSLDRLLQQVHGGEPALLVGTQMLAKGHHFPRVTLVGVVDADSGLFSADFRATERMAQLLLQVAGRAGRGERPGRVLIQTRYPDHPLLQTLIRSGYQAFAEQALQERAEAEYPPFSYQALLRAEANRPEPPGEFLSAVAQWLNALPGQQVELWGPVPAPMARRVGRHRAHLMIQAGAREQLHPVLTALQGYLADNPQARQVRWSLDVDPLDTF